VAVLAYGALLLDVTVPIQTDADTHSGRGHGRGHRVFRRTGCRRATVLFPTL